MGSIKYPPTQDVLHVQKEPSPSKIVESDSTSLDEIKRIMDASTYYEVMGVPRSKSIDLNKLKSQYRKMVIHSNPSDFWEIIPSFCSLFLWSVLCLSRSCLSILIKIWGIRWRASHSKSFSQLMRQVLWEYMLPLFLLLDYNHVWWCIIFWSVFFDPWQS